MPGRFDLTLKTLSLRIAAGFLCFAFFSVTSSASSFSLNYSGRLTHSDGSPIEGPVAIQAKFWNAATDGTQLGQTFEYSGINLSAGIFTVDLAFTADQIAAIFGDGSSLVYIEISSENKTYPRQQFSYVPFALRVPVDGKTLAFDTNGKLSLSLTTKPGTNQFLTKDSDGKLTWGTPAAATIQNQAIATGTPSSGQVLTYNGSQWSASTPTSGGSGVTGTLAVTSGGTGATSFANNGVLIGAGNLPVSTATGSQYQVLTSGAGGTLGFGAVNLAQSAAVSGVLPTANGGTGVNSTATFPTSGVVATRDAIETLTNKTITTATINGNSTISGSTEINTTGSIASGAATVTGNVTLRGNGTTASKLTLNDKGSNNSLSLKAPDTLTSSVTWELPAADGSGGQVLATNGLGTLSWASGAAPTGAASGDLTGSYPNPTLSNVGTAGAYSKVVVDGKGRVTSGSTLAATDIPNLSASQITSGTLNPAQLPTIGTAGTYAKVTTDAYGRVTTGNTLGSDDIPPISASLITSGTVNSALLPTIGSAGTYAKVTTDVYGRITAGTTLSSSDVTSSLGYMPINKSGDTMSGALNLGSYDLTSAGNIQMSASKTFGLSANTADPTGLVSGDKGRTWFNTTTNQIKYWDGSAAVALGVSGSGLSSFNGQTGNTQTLATPGTTGIAPAWSSTSNAHTLNIPLASTASVTAGLISYSDYNTFNGKVAGVTSGTGVSVSTTGNIATVNLATAGTAGTYAKVTTDAYGRVTAGTTLAGTDITSSLGFTPLNKAGDTMSGALTLPANSLVAGTNQLVLANSNVGIGTTNPVQRLEISGGTTLASNGGYFQTKSPDGSTSTELFSINGTNYFGSMTNHDLRVRTNDGDRMTISASGNVGIGTTAPAALLSAGATSQFQVDSAGDLIKVKNIAYSWPSSQGGASTVLTNNGSGSLTWGAAFGGTVTSVTGTAPVSVATGTTTPVISISQANGTTNGYLGSVDWTTFNNKQAAGNYITALTGDGTLSGFSAGSATLTLKNTGTAGTYVKVTTDAQGRVSSGVTTIANADIAAAAGIDATKIGGGGVTTAEFNFLGSVTSDIQTQLNARAPLASPTFTGVLAIPLGVAATPSLTFTGDANTGLWSPAADTIAFSTNGTERVRILSSGNVGIGSASPTSRLDIAINTPNSILTAGYVSLEYFPTAANKYIGGAVGLNFKNKGDGVNWVQKTDTLHNAGGLIASTIETGSMNFYTFPNSGTPTADANLADANLSTYQRMTITAAGYVGVGTSAPQSSMEIYKSAPGALGPVLTLNNPGGGGSSSAIDFQNYSGNTQPIVSRMSIVDDGLYSANLAFSTKITGASGNALAERMRITSTGNVGIGTTNPAAKLHIGGTAGTDGIKFPDGTTQTTAATAGIAVCPTGFTLIGTAGRRGAYCIDTNERAAQTWLNAKQTCTNLNLSEGEAYMCNHDQWYKACVKGTPTGMTGNWEWISEYTSSGPDSVVLGATDCTSHGYYYYTLSYTFRCCIQ